MSISTLPFYKLLDKFLDHKLKYRLKYSLFFICLCVACAISISATPFFVIFGKRSQINHLTGWIMFNLTSFVLSVELSISSYHLPDVYKPSVLIMNHQSEFDVLIVAKFLRDNTAIVGKRELIYVPIFGIYFWLANNILLRRKKKEEAHKAFEEASNQMKKDQLSVIIFPEGTRSYSTTPVLLPFKKGAFHLAVNSGSTIIPIVVENYASTGIFDVKRKIFGEGEVKIRVLDPIPTKGLTATHEEIGALSDRCQSLIKETLLEMSEKKTK